MNVSRIVNRMAHDMVVGLNEGRKWDKYFEFREALLHYPHKERLLAELVKRELLPKSFLHVKKTNYEILEELNSKALKEYDSFMLYNSILDKPIEFSKTAFYKKHFKRHLMKSKLPQEYKQTKPRNHEVKTGVQVHENKKRKEEAKRIKKELEDN